MELDRSWKDFLANSWTDLLAVLREQGSRRHDEILEWIGKSDSPPFVFSVSFHTMLNSMLTRLAVIVLIAAEIVVAAINIVVDLLAGVD